MVSSVLVFYFINHQSPIAKQLLPRRSTGPEAHTTAHTAASARWCREGARQVPLDFGHNAINPGGLGAIAPKDAQHLCARSFDKLNLTKVYATYAEPNRSQRTRL